MDYYPLSDLLYRTVALTDDPDEGDVAVVEAYDTDAYGNTLIFNDPGPDEAWFTDDDSTTKDPICPFIFTGRRYDPETEIYFYRARYYQQGLGRFLSRDRTPYLNGMCAYEYVQSSPCDRRDPSGKSLMADAGDLLRIEPALPYDFIPGSCLPQPACLEPWRTNLPPQLTPLPPAGAPRACASTSPRAGCPPWFPQFERLGCCACEEDAVERQMSSFAEASADMSDIAYSESISLMEAIEATRAGVVATAGGARTERFYRMPECAQKVVDEMERSWIMTGATFLGWAYHAGATYRSTGQMSFSNAWLAMEAKRAEHAVRAISKRLKECERLKRQHPNWRECCREFH